MAEASRRQVEREAAASVLPSVDVLPPATAANTESPVPDTTDADVVENATSSMPPVPMPAPMIPPNMMPPHMLPGS